MVADAAALDHAGHHGGLVDLQRLERDLAVVDEDEVAGRDVAGQPGVRRRADVDVAGDVVGRDGEARTGLEHDRAVGEGAEADLGALQVDEDADAAAHLVGSGTHPLVDPLVVGVRPVREVHAGDVHARLDEGADALLARDSGPEGADDLGAAHRMTLLQAVSGDGKGDPADSSRDPRGRRQARSCRAVGGIGAGRLVEPTSQRSTADAAERPSAIAHTMSDWPRPASPAAKTPGTLVM